MLPQMSLFSPAPLLVRLALVTALVMLAMTCCHPLAAQVVYRLNDDDLLTESFVTLDNATHLIDGLNASGTTARIAPSLVAGLATVATSGNFTDLQNKPTSLQGYGIVGGNITATSAAYLFTITNNGTGSAIYGNSTYGAGVAGESITGAGVYGKSDSGSGISGVSLVAPAIFAESESGSGILASSTSGVGIECSSDSASALWASSNDTYGSIATFVGNSVIKATINTDGTLTLNGGVLTMSGNATLSGTNTGDQTIVSFAAAPATSTSTGTQGQLIQSGNYLYICVATNTWRRIELLNW